MKSLILIVFALLLPFVSQASPCWKRERKDILLVVHDLVKESKTIRMTKRSYNIRLEMAQNSVGSKRTLCDIEGRLSNADIQDGNKIMDWIERLKK